MPIFDFQCAACAVVFEDHCAAGAPEPACPQCGSVAHKVFLTAPAVHDSFAGGREAAMRSLPECGKGCRCCP